MAQLDMEALMDEDFQYENLEDIPEDVLYQMMQQYQEEYGGDFNFGDSQPPPFSYAGHFENCFLPTLTQGVQIITPLVLVCLTMRTISLTGLPATIYHLLSMTAGLTALSYFFENLTIQIVALSLLGYFLLQVTQTLGTVVSKGAVTAVIFVSLLIAWELIIADPVEWNRIRGAQMILVMKIISLAFDLDQEVVSEMPDFMAYLGYTFNIGTVIFGPWISYSTYIRLLHPGDIEKRWILTAFFKYIQSLLCLLISTCLAAVLFIDSEQKWLDAYKDAIGFRFSHYFVSFVSECTAISSGLGAPQEGGNKHWELSVVRPWHVELPRSLVQVVTNWNLPMHMWLKTYVFKTSRKFGNFTAVLLTYAASSLLHGLNFQLAGVLLSLGLYSYIEHVLRQRLAITFNACILARKCKPDCQHLHQSNTPLVALTNFGFCLLAIFHLAYLGVMFDSDPELEEKGYGMEHTLNKWSNLNYASHYVAAGTYIFYWLIK